MTPMGMRIGVIGAGRVTEEYWLPALAEMRARTWLVDTEPARLDGLCRGLLVRRCESIKILAQHSLDAVIVATPARTHAAVAAELAESCASGQLLPVLLEKPPVVRGEELRRLLSWKDQRRIRPEGAFLRRALPAPRVARRRFARWIERFGPLQRIEVWEGRPYAWRSQAARSGAGGLESMLFDELAHAVDLTMFIAGAEVSTPSRLEVNEHTTRSFDGACEVSMDCEIVALQIHGSRERSLSNLVSYRFRAGSVSIEQGFGGGIMVRPDHGPTEPIDAGPVPSLRQIFRDLVVICVEGGAQPDAPVSPLENWQPALAILESLFHEASRESKP